MRSLILSIVLLACGVHEVLAQTIDARTTPIPEILSRFVEEQSVQNTHDAWNAIFSIVNYGWRSQNDIDALISGLDSIAREGSTSLAKANAVVLLISAASTTARNPSPRVGPLVLALFDEVGETHVRGSIVGSLYQLADRSVAVRILRRVLTEEPPDYVLDRAMEARSAVSSALGAGAPGLELLRELHARGTIRDGSAKAMVAELNASGRLRGGGRGPLR